MPAESTAVLRAKEIFSLGGIPGCISCDIPPAFFASPSDHRATKIGLFQS
jgi:hypothetical protein